MAEIKKKITPKYFELVNSGKKRFDLRVADFKIEEGDTLIFEEWVSEEKKYTGRQIIKKVGYILRFPLDSFGQKDLIEKHGLLGIQLED